MTASEVCDRGKKKIMRPRCKHCLGDCLIKQAQYIFFYIFLLMKRLKYKKRVKFLLIVLKPIVNKDLYRITNEKSALKSMQTKNM